MDKRNPLKTLGVILIGLVLTTFTGVLDLGSITSAQATDYYVAPPPLGDDDNSGTSSSTPFATIQTGIDAASDGDRVCVADGTYTGADNRDMDFKAKAITVESVNGPGVTIIDCQGTASSPHRGFYFHNGETTLSVLDGFTIKNGYGPDEVWSSGTWSVGGGIYCTNASPLIKNNIIVENLAKYGAGIQCWESASPTIENNIIKNNNAFASGGGVYFYNNCSGTLRDNIIAYNTSQNGGGIQIDMSSSVVIVNNIVAKNWVSWQGGGLNCGNSSPTITNNTFTRNTNSTSGQGGGAYFWYAAPIITNTIFWGNLGGEIVHTGSTITINHSDIQGGYAGTGNINSDPLFIHPDGDYHLQTGSPCIDFGDNNAPQIPTYDFEGDSRINNGTVDMGADEYVPYSTYIVTGLVQYSTTPLENVTVELRSGPPNYNTIAQTTYTNVLGVYTFYSVSDGDYQVRTYGPTPEYIGWVGYSPVTVTGTNARHDVELPKVIQLISPPYGETIFTINPTLTWTRNNEADYYYGQINDVDLWFPTAHSILNVPQPPTGNPSYTVNGTDLKNDKTYKWQVGADDAQGNWVGTTQMAYQFKICLNPSTFYLDSDEDTYGNPGYAIGACTVLPPPGYVSDNTDCNDDNASVYPGAVEVRDKLDNNCDGSVDEGFDFDGDGLTDDVEIGVYVTDPDIPDTDGDGYSDYREVIVHGTDPLDDMDYAGMPESERDALIDLYNSTNGDSWTKNTGWKDAPLYPDSFAMPGTECSWFGVSCMGNHVTILELPSNTLTGTIPASIEHLNNLSQLGLEFNEISGSIPPELGNLSNLTYLEAHSNNLTGPIPASLGNLHNLQYLDLQNNQLGDIDPATVDIPPELGYLGNLTHLLLKRNQLRGSIPPELGNLTSLLFLWLDFNQLTGSIPPELGNLSNLTQLILNSNQLTGSIPAELGDLADLTRLYLYTNQLTGPIPASLGNLHNLQYLWSAANSLSGPIPASLGNLQLLYWLDLSQNQLSGAIPAELSAGTEQPGNLVSLSKLYLYSNQLIGPVPTELQSLPLVDNQSDFRWNALYITDGSTFLNSKQDGGDWESTQTVAPTDLTATVLSDTSVRLDWMPILYTEYPGYYELWYATISGGPYSLKAYSSPKSTGSGWADGLTPGTTYYFRVRTVTESCENNQNTVFSEYTDEVSATTSGFPDVDGDGMPDWWENAHGLNSSVDDSGLDPDGDGLTNLDEYNNETYPNNPDSDDDGLSDGDEVNSYYTDPLDPDTDSDGVNDGPDNCPYTPNTNQADSDNNGIGDECSDAGTLLFMDDFETGDLSTNWTVGGSEPQTITVVGGRVEARSNGQYIETRQSFSGNFRVELDVEKQGALDHGCWDFIVDAYSNGYLRFDTNGQDGITFDDSCPSNLPNSYDASGINKGTIVYTYSAPYILFSFINDEGNVLNAGGINVGYFGSTKIRISLAAHAGSPRYVDNVKVYRIDSGDEWARNPADNHFYRRMNSLNWMAAERQAERWGAHLVVIDNVDEETWLRSQFGTEEVWIGFSDIKEEGNWVWVNGEPVNYTNWCDGEPNNDSGENTSENAAVMNSQAGTCWNDIPETNTPSSLVEYAATSELGKGFTIQGSVKNVHMPDDSFKTLLEVVIGDDFIGYLPGDIDSITITDPKGKIVASYPEDLPYWPQFRDFNIMLDVPPKIGIYTFTATSGDAVGTATDYQYINRTLPIPDETKLSPANGATVSSKTPTFSWDPIEYTEDIAIYYRLEIWDTGHTERVFATGFVQDMLHYTLPYTLPVGILETGESYKWRVRVTDGPDWIPVQNRSHSEWMTLSVGPLSPHSAIPAIDLNNSWGTVTWSTTYGTDFLISVKVIDNDGVSSDGSSHSVTFIDPSGDTTPLDFDYSESPTSAYYWRYFDQEEPPEPGEFTLTFTVTDPEENEGTAVETVVVDPLALPNEDSITPSLKNPVNHDITATFDNILVNGEITEDFNQYTTIDDINGSLWGWHENASIARDNGNGWLVLEIGDSVGWANGSLSFTNPETINSIQADITVTDISVADGPPRARMSGAFCNNGTGDVFVSLNVKGNRVFWIVGEQWINEQGTYQWNDLGTGDLPMGISVGDIIQASISWDAGNKEFTFTAKNLSTATGPISNTFLVPTAVGPPADPGKNLQTRINLITDTTPTFTWDPVTDANRYRLRIYNYDNNNRREIWRSTFGEQPDYTVPPGILSKNSFYRFRVEAWDTHSPLNVNNVSKTPPSSNDNYMFFTGDLEDEFPFIDLDNHGVFVWNDEVDGPVLTCWVYVHDAQGVPDNIASVTVTFPGGLVENLEYVTSHPSARYTPTSGPYLMQSFLPITSGPYTFTVVDKGENSYSISEDLSLQPIAYPNRSTLSPANNTLVGGTAVNFDWEDVPDVLAGEGFYRVEIYDYDYKRVYDFNTRESQFSLTAGFLKADTVYRYRITTRREFFDQNVDNASACPANYSSMPTFITTSLTGSEDGDQMPDGWETAYGLDTDIDDGDLDSDGDGLINSDEYLNGTDPTKVDTDNDGWSDSAEVEAGSDPTSTDLDNNNNDIPDSVDPDDTDNDGVSDVNDNCPLNSNPDQSDFNNDGIGDGCQDSDEDGINDDVDLCPSDEFNDADGDGICAGMGYRSPMTGQWDNCPWVANPDQLDDDFDLMGDACDADISGERPTCGVGQLPPCPPETTIDDTDGDGLSDDDETNIYGTDPTLADTDGDGVDDGEDNCKLTPNPYDIDADGNGTPDTQTDTDNDGLGDICDPDDDNDGICDAAETLPDGTPGTPSGGCTPNPQNLGDNCRLIANSDQADMDNDGEGDVCDVDIDGDGLTNQVEVGLGTSTTNPDTDGDGIDDGDEVTAGTDPLTPEGAVVYKIVFSALDVAGADITNTWIPSLTWDEANQQWVHDEVIVVARFKNPDGNFVDFPAGNVTFTLIPSTWEGVAINDTEEYTGQPSNDFSFDQTNKDELIKVETVETPISEITFSLFAFDFGGQAKIMASTLDPNGEVAEGEITLPLDSDMDLLPDEFEKANATDGFDHLNAFSLGGSKNDGLEDIDISADNTHDGDGITNFMEYRGWVSDTLSASGVITYNWQHLSHTNKDLFVRGDNFANSIPVSTAPGVLPFSVDHNTVYAAHGGGPNAFEEAGIHVHDVTGMPSFAGPEEPPNIDILVVTNETETRADELIETIMGLENGYINHPSTSTPRYWTWDLKGASYIGNIDYYAIFYDEATGVTKRGTFTYHLCLMHYIHNRPYKDVEGVGACDTGNTYVGKLDPLNKVEDWYKENGTDPPDSKGNKKEDCCVTNSQLDGDRMDPAWKTILYGPEKWHRGKQLSVFDANCNGLIENPRVDDPVQITKEYNPEMIQLHTVIHEMGHGVGCDGQHTTDPTCVMYQDSPNWDRAGHFCSYALSQIYIHNMIEY